MFKATGLFIFQIYQSFIQAFVLAGEMIAVVPLALRYPKKSLDIYFNELFLCAPKSILVIFVVAFSFGTVIAAISGPQFRLFGAEIYIANLIGVAVSRELAPIITAICLLFLVAARYTDETASLELLDKQTFVRCLIRMLATATAAPLLSLFALYFATLGGAIVSIKAFDLSWLQYWSQIFSVVPLMDVVIGLFKSMVFGVEVAFIGCFYGIICQFNQRGLGKSIIACISMGIIVVAFTDSLLEFVLHQNF